MVNDKLNLLVKWKWYIYVIVCFQVHSIDLGEVIEVTEARVLPEDLRKVESLARRCSLALPPGTKEWPRQANLKFNQFVNRGKSRFTLVPTDLTSDKVCL